jgi:predicted lipid-binding transport protein (Tim44 family)
LLIFEILSAVADAEGVDSVEDLTPLADVIDPDALVDLVDSTDTASVRFRYHGREVTVESGGAVTVRE